MSEDMSNLMNQINNMMKNNEIPDEIKNIINNLNSNHSQNNSSTQNDFTQNSSSSPQEENSSISGFDMETMMKLKKVMDSMKESRNDPRANLLKSLKPYLKKNRQEKIDQYIQIFGMEKAFEMFGPLGGEKHK